MISRRLKDVLRTLILTAFLASALAGCAVFDELSEDKGSSVSPIPHRKPATKQLGSLWTEDSMWNDVYTAAASRVVGDIVTVRIDDAFKKRVAKLLNPEAQDAPAAGGDKDRSVASTDTKGASELILRGVIEEVGPRGVYRIAAKDTLRMGGPAEPFVAIKGRVRDRDIDGNDEIKVADIVDLNLEAYKAAPAPGQTKGVDDVSW